MPKVAQRRQPRPRSGDIAQRWTVLACSDAACPKSRSDANQGRAAATSHSDGQHLLAATLYAQSRAATPTKAAAVTSHSDGQHLLAATLHAQSRAATPKEGRAAAGLRVAQRRPQQHASPSRRMATEARAAKGSAASPSTTVVWGDGRAKPSPRR
ncbi:hypothetical protein [Paenibacillus cellulosilyticus]|uniref:hypothetical protein n=1 Tax=Paenibacillus cellulosilyticus TaxID=375489 RepID=UPI0011B3F2BB|nr:hypothetical protein [Paenibacillus cellulosilyticus]